MSTPNPSEHKNPLGFTKQDPVHDALNIDDASAKGSKAAGYELSDANISGIVAFLGVLVASLGVFFVFCFALGKLINHEIIKYDGPASTWVAVDGRNLSPAQREIIVSNSAMQQEQLSIMTKKFPTPRLQLDDGNQDTADMHGKEDLLLDYYSYVNQGAGTVRIPITRAMQLVAQRGLPVIGATAGKTATAVEPLGEQGRAAQSPTVSAEYGTLAGVEPVKVTAPLTDGFARTGWEQEVDEERHQRLESREAMQEQEQQDQQRQQQKSSQ
jgi:hypothetical protein